MISAIALSLAVSMGYANKPDAVKVEAKWKNDNAYVALQAVPSTREGFFHAGAYYDFDAGNVRLSPYLGAGIYYEDNIRHPWRTNHNFTPRAILGAEVTVPVKGFRVGLGVQTITSLTDPREQHMFDNYGGGQTYYLTVEFEK
jgi:hypothetical protein